MRPLGTNGGPHSTASSVELCADTVTLSGALYGTGGIEGTLLYGGVGLEV